ncbi:MAG: hypothetical protein GY679_01475 [Mycoplasma sp.]|nr:hypothetical protein [Mycoplasma sp.]
MNCNCKDGVVIFPLAKDCDYYLRYIAELIKKIYSKEHVKCYLSKRCLTIGDRTLLFRYGYKERDKIRFMGYMLSFVCFIGREHDRKFLFEPAFVEAIKARILTAKGEQKIFIETYI